MAEEWDFQARPLVKEPRWKERVVSVQDLDTVRTALASGLSLIEAAAAVGHLSSDVDRALWSYIGVRIRRDGSTLTVE